MIREQVSKWFYNVSMALSNNTVESVPSYKGEVFWTLTNPDGDVINDGHLKNVVTKDAGVLLAWLMKTGSNLPASAPVNFGILGLAVGSGDTGWGVLPIPPSGTPTQRALYSERMRKKADSIEFINSSGLVSPVPTNVIDIKTTFGPSEANGEIREMGLIGGNCNTNLNIRSPVNPPNGPYNDLEDLTYRDTLLNYVTIPLVTKTNGSSLTWTWRLTF